MDENIQRFSLMSQEIPIILETPDGMEKKYILRELSGRDRDGYLTSMGSKVRLDAKGDVVGITSFDGIQAGLLVLCLYDEDNKRLDIKDIQSFPTNTQTELYKIAQRLNNLDEGAEERAKND